MSETNIPALPNCLSQSAFTVLDTDSSKAPILRYSIPQNPNLPPTDTLNYPSPSPNLEVTPCPPSMP
ncbi:MAG: hypothetical protein IPL33_19895 [Sphingobacteriales bacterium]|nr:hypothetical protein [Sphingobacteriales bacterium]